MNEKGINEVINFFYKAENKLEVRESTLILWEMELDNVNESIDILDRYDSVYSLDMVDRNKRRSLIERAHELSQLIAGLKHVKSTGKTMLS